MNATRWKKFVSRAGELHRDRDENNDSYIFQAIFLFTKRRENWWGLLSCRERWEQKRLPPSIGHRQTASSKGEAKIAQQWWGISGKTQERKWWHGEQLCCRFKVTKMVIQLLTVLSATEKVGESARALVGKNNGNQSSLGFSNCSCMCLAKYTSFWNYSHLIDCLFQDWLPRKFLYYMWISVIQ